MTFGTRLAAARRDAGLTQQELGQGLGTDGANASKSVVYGWEKDQHAPRVDQLMMICERLSCSADYLLFGKQANLTPEALRIAGWVDKLTDPRDRAWAEIEITDLVVGVLKGRNRRPTDTQAHDPRRETPHEPGQFSEPASPPTPAKTQKPKAEQSGRRG
jgi:transcriptional regulator with XRE-family HTH domain